MFSRQLAERAAENNPIRVGIIGAGKFDPGCSLCFQKKNVR